MDNLDWNQLKAFLQTAQTGSLSAAARKLGLSLARKTIRKTIGNMEDYGLPKPDHEPLEAHPSVSGEFLTRAGCGDITFRPGIKALVGFVGFVVALISLAALRNFGPVLFYVGLAIFAAVGLVIAGAIMGAVI